VKGLLTLAELFPVPCPHWLAARWAADEASFPPFARNTGALAGQPQGQPVAPGTRSPICGAVAELARIELVPLGEEAKLGL
jgi:hypothetical protein